MNGTNRGLNRTILAIFGLILAGAGTLAILAGVSRGFAQSLTSAGTNLWSRIQERLDAARISGAEISWWTIAVLVLLIVVAVLLVSWLASQGTGRSNELAKAESPTGNTTVDIAVAAQAIKAALAENNQILASSVQSWKTRGIGSDPGLKIVLQARKGASPAEVRVAVEHLVLGLDELLGIQLPVLIRIKAGTRSKFARTERVA